MSVRAATEDVLLAAAEMRLVAKAAAETETALPRGRVETA
jgi:hypothetical protein